MRRAEIYSNGVLAGILTEDDQHRFTFIYNDDYYSDFDKPAISLTLPKSQKNYSSEVLFPFFFNMLSEGVNRKLQSRALQIDEKDHFGFLLTTANNDTIGSITVKPIIE